MSVFSLKSIGRFFLASVLFFSLNNVIFARGAVTGEINDSNNSQGSILDSSNVIELIPGVQVFNRDLNLLIKLDNIQDSRCTIDPLVACFWAGNVKVTMSIISRSKFLRDPQAEWDKISLILGVNGEKADVLLGSGYVLKLVQVLPLPELDPEVVASPVVTLTYEKADVNNDQINECDNQEASPAIPGIIELKYGAPISNCDLNLELKLVNVADSRCPIGALCFWQGSVQVSIAIVDSSKIKRDAAAKWDVITLGLEEGVLLSSGYILKLENVLPYPDLNAEPVESPVVVLTYSKAEVN